MMKNNCKKVRIRRLHDQGKEDDLKGTTTEERIGMMWQLAQDAWAFMGEPIAEPKLSRHVVRIIRRKR